MKYGNIQVTLGKVVFTHFEPEEMGFWRGKNPCAITCIMVYILYLDVCIANAHKCMGMILPEI